jgi:radical SAM-linked protein
MLEDFLPLVAKPARYINSEINSIHKDLAKVKTKFCLFFPDTYEVGMSHLGLKILYHILNKRDDTACERVFSPWIDYEKKLRTSERPLTSLESNIPLSQFDIIGITLQYELSYTNILTGLALGGIPLHSSRRADSHPVIIAGGPCAVNPEPLAEFIDAFFIGEAEESIHEIVDLRQDTKSRGRFLESLSEREGFYVPALGKKIVRRRVIRDLESAAYPDKPILPLMKPVHDRVTVEVARGCIRGCRFCQAGMIYRPYRERSPNNVKALLQESISCTGYDELSLAALSAGDYSSIQPLMQDLVTQYRQQRISISLPSLRVGTLTSEMIKAVADTRKTGFTLAPEAGTERLRRVINKPVSDLELLDAAETIFKNGWSVLKLYFMIGLPTETEEDLDGIVRLVNNLFALGKKTARRNIQVNVTISTFVPKPHTPFQWMGQSTLEDIRLKQSYLEKKLKKRGITLKPHGPVTSLLEGAFARGDRALGRVLEEAVRLGCRFDGWSECFDFKKWREAFQNCGLEMSAYAYRTFGFDEALPWDHVQSGVSKEFLWRENQRAMEEEITENCRVDCRQCGMECKDGGSSSLGISAHASPLRVTTEAAMLACAQQMHLKGPELSTRLRFKYTKTGRIRFLSHLDLMTLVQRAAARAQVPILFSQGFNPHPRIAFGPALSVGMESEAEYLDMETDPFVDLLLITKALNKTLPEGIRILESRIVPSKFSSLSGSIGRYIYEVRVPTPHERGLDERLKNFLARTSVVIAKDGKQRDIRPGIETMVVTRSTLAPYLLITLVDGEQLKPRVQDVIEQLFNINQEQVAVFGIKRVGMFYREKDQWLSPMDVK